MPYSAAMTRYADVVIIGGGLAGACLAAVLGRGDVRTLLIDPHDVAPSDFRAEKVSPFQLDAFERLGLGKPILAQATLIDRLAIARFGQIVERRSVREYGIDYADLVDAVRSQVPAHSFVRARAHSISSSPDRQTITLGDGQKVETRFVVVATGLGRTVLNGSNIQRIVVSPHHCLAIGLDLAMADRRLDHPALTIHARPEIDRSAYLTVFPIKDRLRANLFTYRAHNEHWAHAFRHDPLGKICETMPELERLMPGLSSVGPPVLRPIHLHVSEGHLRDGIVLVGDAFATTCPTGGGGISKVLTDVERLTALLPRWLATPGSGRDKIAGFYDDPVKRKADGHAARRTAYARAMALDQSALWAARRYRNYYAQRLLQWARSMRAGRSSAYGADSPPSSVLVPRTVKRFI